MHGGHGHSHARSRTRELVLPDGHPGDDFLRRVAHDLQDKFDIGHPTLQVELGDAAECPLRCELPA